LSTLNIFLLVLTPISSWKTENTLFHLFPSFASNETLNLVSFLFGGTLSLWALCLSPCYSVMSKVTERHNTIVYLVVVSLAKSPRTPQLTNENQHKLGLCCWEPETNNTKWLTSLAVSISQFASLSLSEICSSTFFSFSEISLFLKFC